MSSTLVRALGRALLYILYVHAPLLRCLCTCPCALLTVGRGHHTLTVGHMAATHSLLAMAATHSMMAIAATHWLLALTGTHSLLVMAATHPRMAIRPHTHGLPWQPHTLTAGHDLHTLTAGHDRHTLTAGHNRQTLTIGHGGHKHSLLAMAALTAKSPALRLTRLWLMASSEVAARMDSLDPAPPSSANDPSCAHNYYPYCTLLLNYYCYCWNCNIIITHSITWKITKKIAALFLISFFYDKECTFVNGHNSLIFTTLFYNTTHGLKISWNHSGSFSIFNSN